jgi:hypothetical protein
MEGAGLPFVKGEWDFGIGRWNESAVEFVVEWGSVGR